MNKSVYIPAPLRQELKAMAAQTGEPVSQMVHRLLQEGLERERMLDLEQKRTLWKTYQAIADEHAVLAEVSAQYASEVLDHNEDWAEYQE
jgi:hypothetical protein